MPATVIFKYPQVKHMVVDGVVNSSGAYMIINSFYTNTEIKVWRNVSTPLDFLVKDYDRQPVNVAGTLRFMVWTKPDLPPLIDSPMTAVDATKGWYRYTMTPQESSSLRLGFYSWGVVQSVNGVDTLLYADRNYATDPTLQVVEGIPQSLQEPTEIDPTTFTPDLGVLVGSAIPASGLMGGQHTAVYTMDNFTGSIKFQGSLDEDVPSNEGWIDVNVEAFDNVAGTISRSFEGNFTWTRFIISTATGLTNIAYRN